VVPAWVGFVAYDAALPSLLKGGLRLARPAGRPVARWARYRAVFAFDHAEGRAFYCGDDAEACAELRARVHAGRPKPPEARASAPVGEDPAQHLRAIDAALDHIGRGDVYQVNLARRFSARYEGSSLALFLAMREASPVPFGFFAETDRLAVLGRSMERFLRWEGPGGRLESRPIKGTAPRPPSDRGAVEQALRADAKERAEHAMIVDLMRNDLGRVAVTGSVEVAGLFEVEPYARLSHLVSTVRCRTRPEVTLADVLEATFPPGSVTGAPKVRAVQLIEALERSARGVYCGAYGHVDRTGGLHLAVAIRTATIASGVAEYHAGGGLVEASVPRKELAETELKARAFLDALAKLPTL
jgi:anthranilate/para-aminobenzoate synthase component I